MKRAFHWLGRSFRRFQQFSTMLLGGFCVVKVTWNWALPTTGAAWIEPGGRQVHSLLDCFLHFL